MKLSRVCIPIIGAAFLSALVYNQLHAAPGSQARPQVGKSAGVQSPEYLVTERGPHHRVWERTEYTTAPDGKQVPQVHRYTELATGMHYKNAKGQWVESKAEIKLLPKGAGAAASEGQHKVVFPPDLYDGQIELNTPDEKWLRSRVLGLAYYDTASGQSVLIAETIHSTGELHEPNVVIYPDAFEGLHIDVRYTYTLSGFEQDLIVREQPPAPEAYGLDGKTTQLEVWTEFMDSPKPGKKVARVRGKEDETLDFGAMKMGRGKAFALGEEMGKQHGKAVRKIWQKLDGRDFLIEAVEFKGVEGELKKLSPAALNRSSLKSRVVQGRTPPVQRLVKQSDKTFQIAKTDLSSEPGYVLDYTTVNGTLNSYTFQGDTTYYIPSGVYFNGTVTFEGGTVIKFQTNSPAIYCWNGFICPSNVYRPAVLTSMNDNSVGETITGSNGNPVKGSSAGNSGWLNATGPFRNIRFSYAPYPTWLGGEGTVDFWDCQFVHCGFCVPMDDYSPLNLGFYNVLFADCDQAFATSGESGGGVHVTMEQVTADVGALGWGCELDTLTLRNSIIRGNAGWDGILYNYNSQINPTGPVFQTVGGGRYYLTNNPNFRDAGTVSINPDLLVELKKKTTYAPIAYTNVTFNSAMTFSPRGLCDTNAPDLGYHYDPLDYTFGGCTANSNITFTAGTAAGWFRTSSGWEHAGHGIHMADRQVASFAGTAIAPCYWVRLNTAQEQDLSGGYGPGGITSWAGDLASAATVQARFTKCLMMNSDANHFRDDWGALIVRARDCEFYSGGSGGYNMSMYFTNCLFERNYIAQIDGNYAAAVIMRNCTVKGRGLEFSAFYPMNFSVRDCSFDGAAFQFSGYGANASYADYDYNAYTNSTNPFPLGGSHDKHNVAFNWQAGPLGNYYLPAYHQLINAGSQWAPGAGLWHYTTQTALNSEENNSTVDIGYHYVTVDGAGNPKDSDNDGVLDCLEDDNGNGQSDPGETPWDLSICWQPQSQAVRVGDTAVFVVGAGVSLNYQWRFNGANLANENGLSLTLNNIQTNQAGNYSVVITDGYASITSSVAVLTVVVPPTVTLISPTNGFTCAAPANLTLTASATAFGASITNVQFFRDNGVKLGETSAGSGNLYSIAWPNVPSGMYGLSAVAYDGHGVASTSLVAQVTVGNWGVVNGVNLNGPAVQIEGNNWWSYEQALTNGLTVSSNARPGFVIVTNLSPGCDLNTSNMLQSFLRCDRLPPISQQQTNFPWFSVNMWIDGTKVTFSNIPPGYVITNATYLGWRLKNVWELSQGTYYTSLVYYAYGNTTGLNSNHYSPANLSLINYAVNHRDPSWDLDDVKRALGALVNYSDIPRNPSVQYQIVSNACKYGVGFVPAANQIGLVLADPGLSRTVMGVQITNKAVGFTLTQTITNGSYYVFLWLAENELSHLRSLNIKVQGMTVASGVGDLALGEWRKLGPYPATVTNGTVTIGVESPVLGDPLLMGFTIYGSSVSSSIVPSIITQPESQTVTAGGQVSFSVVASGPALTYQWEHDGVDIAGATSATLTITGAQSADGGIYRVRISNAAGSVESRPVTLVVVSGATYYVATNGNDYSNTGTNLDQPFKTIQKALDTAVAGNRIYIRGGTYREKDLKVKANHSGMPGNLLSISSYSNEVVILKGSGRVSGWTYVTNGIWKRTDWSYNSQQVFVHSSPNFPEDEDGIPLRQVGMPNELFTLSTNTDCNYVNTNYQWYIDMYDPPNRRTATSVTNIQVMYNTNSHSCYTKTNFPTVLTSVDQALAYMSTNPGTFFNGGFSNGQYIGTELYVHLAGDVSPNDRGVEASTNYMILNSETGAGYIHVQNLRFRHSNSTGTDSGWAAVGAATNWILENCDIQWTDFGPLNGIPKIINCNLSNNGDSGGAGSYTYGCTITNNNYRNFGRGWLCGGVKYGLGPVDFGPITIEYCTVSDNNGPGIWFDGCTGGSLLTIRNNYFTNNISAVLIEVSTNAAIYNNVIAGSKGIGISLSTARGSKVYNNTIVGTITPPGDWGAAILVVGPPRDGLHTNMNNEVRNNIVYINPDDVGTYGLVITSNTVNNTSDYNCFYKPNGVVTFSDEGRSYSDLSQWSQATGRDTYSTNCDPQFVNFLIGDFRLKSGSQLIDRGQTLPIVPFDYQGLFRPQGAGYDIGAFEGTYLVAPSIVIQPQSQTVTVGNQVSFSVAANGTALNYQWEHDGVDISGATSATLTIANAQSADGGIYRVRISNSFGSLESVLVTLAVEDGTRYYVATDGLDSNSGKSLAQPFKTIQKAFDTVGAGDSIYIRGGTYRELVYTHLDRTNHGTAGNRILVSAYTNEFPVIKGSEVVTGAWTYVTNGIWVRTNWPYNSQQVFVHDSTNFSTTDEGVSLQQVGMPNERFSLKDNTNCNYVNTNYWFDISMYDPPNRSTATTVTNILMLYDQAKHSCYAATNYTVRTSVAQALAYMSTNPGTYFNGTNDNNLYVHLPNEANPNTKGIEASTREAILFFDSEGVGRAAFFHFKNLRFRHSNVTAVTTQYPDIDPGNGCIFERCDAQWCDFEGINGGDGSIINCDVSNNGNNASAAALVYGCTITNNNYRHFKTGWHGGGMKIPGPLSKPMTIENCYVAGNYGVGIWFDGCSSGNLITIRNNYVADNLSSGIMIEISTNALIYNNICVRNEGCGIYVSGSSGVKVYNNTVVDTKVAGGWYPWTGAITLDGVPRDNGSGGLELLVNNEVRNNIIWNTETYVDLWISTNGAWGASNNISDYNCFYSTNRAILPGEAAHGTSSFSVEKIGVDGLPVGLIIYTNLIEWKTRTGFDQHSLNCDPQFVNAPGGNFRLQPGSPLVDQGQAIPMVQFDYSDITRPQGAGYDYGAYEQ